MWIIVYTFASIHNNANMEILITQADMLEMLKEKADDSKVQAIKDLVEYYRYKQREFGNGVEELTYLVHTGAMNLSLYIPIRQAVENPTTPYEVILTK